MKKIVWIFGVSAAGKETFMKSVIGEDKLRKKLGLENVTVAISEESLSNLGKLDGSRLSVVSEVETLIKTNDAVLIKWQYGDSILNSPEVLYKKFSKAEHIIVNLVVTLPEQVNRLKAKSWWHEVGKEESFIAKETVLVRESIKKLRSTFSVLDVKW